MIRLIITSTNKDLWSLPLLIILKEDIVVKMDASIVLTGLRNID